MRGLKEKVVVVTGAAGGIGRALVQRFCEEGARVVAADINPEALDRLQTGLRDYASQLIPLALDITDHAAVAHELVAVADRTGSIDVLINNAGWDQPIQFVDTTPDFWDKVIAINLRGPLNLQHVVVHGRGRVRAENLRRPEACDSAQAPRPAGRHSGRRSLPFQRRREFHHRPGHQRVRRTDHARIRGDTDERLWRHSLSLGGGRRDDHD